MKLRNVARQAGFTLVEIAIVLVIIGLLLVGVLQGQEMIENTKTKSVVSDMKAIQAAYNGYLDRYKNLPGDELAATMAARGWGGAAATTGNADGILAMAAADTFVNAASSATTEQRSFWRALRGSGLLSGDVALVGTDALPRHSAGGLIGVATGAGGVGNLIYGQSGVFVCASGLSTKQAAAVDTMIDGPLPATNIGNSVGNLRGASGAAPLAPASPTPAGLAYNEVTTTTPWTVCMKIG